MGQKTNPNILRLGVTKNWKTEFFEKKKKELPLYVFKDLELQNYLERFLERNNIIVHDYRQHYSNNTVNLYISYFVPVTSNFFFKKKDIFLVTSAGNRKMISDPFKNSDFYKVNFNKLLEKDMNYTFIELYYIKKYLKLNSKFANKNLIFNLTVLNNSIDNMLKVISKFTSNKFDVKINFSCINKNFNYLSILKNKKIKMLQKFQSASFFKEGLELLFHVVFNKNSSRLLAKFISLQLRRINRPNFFLSFIKTVLGIFISSRLSMLRGIKIMLKGRLSKGPRAKHKTIIIGDVPVQSFNSNMDYFQTTTHNSNGSYGIKVWIVEK